MFYHSQTQNFSPPPVFFLSSLLVHKREVLVIRNDNKIVSEFLQKIPQNQLIEKIKSN